MSIKVDFIKNTNQITINNKNYLDITKKIRSIMDGVSPVDFNKMKTEQQILNYLDSIKDGANAVTLQQLNIYPLYTAYGYAPVWPKDLTKIENNIEKAYSPYISNITWTKMKKQQELNSPLPIDNIFRDCGLAANVFIRSGFKLFNTFAAYIDPATRGPPDNVWPDTNQSIEFTNNFMELFGLDNSSLQSTTKNLNNFTYNITSNGINFSHNGSSNDPNLSYFSGNNNKNKLLKSGSTPTSTKKALISLKEWGDKMQVLFLFVWKHVNPNLTYTMITCDKVVYTLCLMLGVKCIFTGGIEVNGIKSYSIRIFEPSANPKADAIKRFEKSKKEIIKDNESFMNIINLLKKNPFQHIKIGGDNKPHTFKKEFYEKIYKDLLSIQTKLKAVPIPDSTISVPDIELQKQELKENYLFIPFFRSIKGSLKILANLRYTSKYKEKPSFNNSKKAFYEIGKNDYKLTIPNEILNNISRNSNTNRRQNYNYTNIRRQGGSKYVPIGPKAVKASTTRIKDTPSSSSTFTPIQNIPEVMESDDVINSDFYEEPILFNYYETVPVEKEDDSSNQIIDFIKEEKQIDLNKELYNQVYELSNEIGYGKFIDSIYSMILFYSEMMNGIPLDYKDKNSNLKIVVNYIIQNDLDLPQIQQPSVTKEPSFAFANNNMNQSIAVGASGGKKKLSKKNKTRKRKTKKNKKYKKPKKTKKQKNIYKS